MTGVDALGLTILPDGRACSCGPAMGSRDPGCILHPLPERPEWVRLVTTLSDAPLGAHKVVGWNDGGAPIILADDDTTRIHLPRALWVPADPPEPSDPEEVCPEFTHTGYCPDRLCERGCKHEPAWKVGDRVEHTIHGTGTVVRHGVAGLRADVGGRLNMRTEPHPADWVERQLGGALTGDHRRALAVLGTITAPSGFYNLPTPCKAIDAFAFYPSGSVSVILQHGFSTYDDSALTRLVVEAHRHRVRVRLRPWSPHLDPGTRRARSVVETLEDDGITLDVDDRSVGAGILEILLQPLQAEGHDFEIHPGLDELRQRVDSAGAQWR